MVPQIEHSLAVQLVTSSAEGNREFGTAFAFKKENGWTYFLTAAHVIINVGVENILLANKLAEVVALGRDDEVDLAVLRIKLDTEIPLLPLKEDAKIDSDCLIISCQVLKGNLFVVPTKKGKLGRLTSIYNHETAVRVAAWDIGTEFDIQKGNSGSPLIDENDNSVVGVVIKKGYAIASRELRKILNADSAYLFPSKDHIDTGEQKALLNGIRVSELVNQIKRSYKSRSLQYPYPGFRLKEEQFSRQGNYFGLEQMRFLSATQSLLCLVFENQKMLLNSLPYFVYAIACDTANNIGNEKPIFVPVVLDLPTEDAIDSYFWPRLIASELAYVNEWVYRQNLVAEILQPNSLGVQFLLIVKIDEARSLNPHILRNLLNWCKQNPELKIGLWIATTLDTYMGSTEEFKQLFPVHLELFSPTGNIVIPARRMSILLKVKHMDYIVREALIQLSTTMMPLGERSRGTIWRMDDIESELLKFTAGRQEQFEVQKTDRLVHTPASCILIVTTTKVETEAVDKVFHEQGNKNRNLVYIGDHSYYDLGTHGNVPVYLVRAEENVTMLGLNSAPLTLNQAIQDLQPQAIIMCGVCYGLQPTKQHLGDILIAKQLQYYEQPEVDIKQGLLPQGNRAAISERLLERFSRGVYNWDNTKIHFGLFVSSPKLTDPDLYDWFLQNEPEAIGGEIGGVNLHAAALGASVDWITVKSISDWPDNQKNEDAHALAAQNAAQFVLDVLKMGGWDKSKEMDFISNSLALASNLKTKTSFDLNIIINATRKLVQRIFEDENLQLLEDGRVIFGPSWGPEVFLAYKLFQRNSEVTHLLPKNNNNFDIVALYLASLDDKYYLDILQWALDSENNWLAAKCLIFNEPPYVSETIRQITRTSQFV